MVLRLLQLLHKYDLLCALCATPPGRTAARRDAMRAVSSRFPAALREWEAVPEVELRRRRAVVAHALATAQEAGEGPLPDEPWLRYGLTLHGHLRGLQQVRRALRDQPADLTDDELLARCRQIYEQEGGPLPFDRQRLCALQAPPAGRLSGLAYADLAAAHGTSAAAVQAALFGAPTSGFARQPDEP